MESKRITVNDLNVSVRAGLNSVRNQDTVEKLLNRVRAHGALRFRNCLNVLKNNPLK